MSNRNDLPRWPRFLSETDGNVTVTGRHDTPGSKSAADNIAGLLGFSAMINAFFFDHSPVNRMIVAIVQLFRPDWDRASIYGWLFFLGLFVIPLLLLGMTPPLFRLLFTPRTTVWFFADRLEIRHLRFFRRRFYWAGADNIEFFNTLHVDGITVVHTPGQSTHVQSDERNSLYMRYGHNDVLLATFLTQDKAKQFAIVANAAIEHCKPRRNHALGMTTIARVGAFEIISPPEIQDHFERSRELRALPPQSHRALPHANMPSVRRRKNP